MFPRHLFLLVVFGWLGLGIPMPLQAGRLPSLLNGTDIPQRVWKADFTVDESDPWNVTRSTDGFLGKLNFRGSLAREIGEIRPSLSIEAIARSLEAAAQTGNSRLLAPVVGLSFPVEAIWWDTLFFKLSLPGLAIIALLGAIRIIERRSVRSELRHMEKENAVERERSRLARDLHDDLGANLTQITIASELLKRRLPPSDASLLDEISASARATIESLDEIVWAVNPRHDSLASFVEYISKFAHRFCRSSEIHCHIEAPGHLPDLQLASHVRHHFFLLIKEILNNLVKYSATTTALLKVEIVAGTLRITIQDFGRGFDAGALSPCENGNGCRHMHERMTEIGGHCQIESHPGQGTCVTLELPLPQLGAKERPPGNK